MKWWHFWSPSSGFAGGAVSGLLFVLIIVAVEFGVLEAIRLWWQ